MTGHSEAEAYDSIRDIGVNDDIDKYGLYNALVHLHLTEEE